MRVIAKGVTARKKPLHEENRGGCDIMGLLTDWRLFVVQLLPFAAGGEKTRVNTGRWAIASPRVRAERWIVSQAYIARSPIARASG